ncbi:exopolyphosphatase PRUNE1 isoform X2 [Python bivittatus]|uniref:Exopolyphosphatase PRUNE1 isoform X2 n=1 Tax=Python bivittatus TaxID=176946 RepID=A0A9F5MY41_PYTBI|nr:exopolyphosphatase PRUNE1 isoform X2 [Python bivittatus]
MESFLGGCRAALQVSKNALFCSRLPRHTPPLETLCFPQSRPVAARISPGEAVQSQKEVHVVLGNEACDLDSTVSALALAYFLAKTSPDSKAAFIPVLNIPRVDFPLRTESTFLLQQQRIPENLLIFRDEIDLAALHQAGLLSLTLVDHHILPRDAALGAAVVEVVDHRPLERRRAPPCRVTAELVGSCTTLVTERILQGPVRTLNSQVAALLYGTILLDCVNMAAEAGKVTPKDTHYVSLLESMFPELQTRSLVFDALQRAKFDVSGLTTEQMLRKDLKSLAGKGTAVAISAIYVALQDFLHRPGLEQDLGAFCRQRGYDVLIAMTISFGARNEPFRQLAVYSQQAERQAAVCQALERSSSPSLSLSRLESPCPTIRAYHQGNTTASRKKVLPIVQDFLRQRAGHHPAGPSMQPDLSGCGPPTRVDPQGAGSRGPDRNVAVNNPPKPHRLGEDVADDDTPLPPTPVNSLVDECPLHQGLPQVLPEAIFEKVTRIATDRSLAHQSPEKK